MYTLLKQKFMNIIKEKKIGNEHIDITTSFLTTKEAIGNPIHDDYPIIKGKERMMKAVFRDSSGVAFTDTFGEYSGTIFEIMENLEINDNFKGAILISTMNAVLRHLGLIDKTNHCKDDDLINCKNQLTEYIKKNYGNPSILLVGFQPRFAEELTEKFKNVIILDMDENNIGKIINNSIVINGEKWQDYINEVDLIFATGSTFVNNSAKNFFKENKNVVFFGVSGAAPSYLLNIPRYCPCGK